MMPATMMVRPPVVVLACLACFAALAACSQSQGQTVAPSAAASGYPARLVLDGAEQPLAVAPRQPDGGRWAASGDQVTFGVPGQPPLLALSCRHDAAGAASLGVVRLARAEAGAAALFALIGNRRIARLALNVVQPGEPGRWEGVIPAADPRLDVLRGGNAIEATLPGGGTLMLPASAEPGRLLAACRARLFSPDGEAAPARFPA